MWTDDDGRRTPDHGYTISSPCEPEGSGELKTVLALSSIILWELKINSNDFHFSVKHSRKNLVLFFVVITSLARMIQSHRKWM